MKIMVVGGGGREAAIIKSIKKNQKVEEIYALPGNGGIAKDAICVGIDPCDLDGVTDFAVQNDIDFAVVAPDDPLVMGLCDRLREKNIPCFGPSKDAAIIEGSKAFSKELMKAYGIPTAEYEIFDDMEGAISYIQEKGAPLVIKASGLAKGKGVIIAHTENEAEEAVKSMMKDRIFGESGGTVVIEEFLTGPEVTVLSFTDGETLIPMISSMDHKRAFEGDKGPNTGGMGVVAPNPFYTKEVEETCYEEIFLPTLIAMNKEGRTFKGCLYFGLMITKDGPKVIEYNCRFGDPEAQAVLPLLESDLLEIMIHVEEGSLDEAKVEFSNDASCCVIMASEGYPKAYEKGFPIETGNVENLFVAGAELTEDGRLLTNGGRVLGITEKGADIEEAVANAYSSVEKVHFENAYYRKDIGEKAMEAMGE